MPYNVREKRDGTWEVIDLATGRITKLGTLPLAGLHRDEAITAMEMLESPFQQAVREKQNDEEPVPLEESGPPANWKKRLLRSLGRCFRLRRLSRQ